MNEKIGFWVSIFCISLLFAGCATERKVIGNNFQSSHPKLNIQVDQRFKYLGTTTTEGSESDYMNKDITYLNHREYYLFVPKDASKILNQFLLISIRSTTAQRFQNTIQGNMRNLNLGTVNMQDDTYNSYSSIFSPAGTWDVNKFVMKSGYLLPSCIIGGYFESYSYKSTMIGIYYYEDAAPSGMNCKQRYSRDGLTDKQQKYLQGLHQRAVAAIGQN